MKISCGLHHRLITCKFLKEVKSIQLHQYANKFNLLLKPRACLRVGADPRIVKDVQVGNW